MCVKNQTIKAKKKKKDAIPEPGEGRTFEFQTSKEKTYMGEVLAMASRFLGTRGESVREPDSSLQASAVTSVVQFITAQDCRLSKDRGNRAPARRVGSVWLVNVC